MVVSNSAGTSNDHEGEEAKLLEQATGVKVFKHSTKKPGCGLDVFKYLHNIPEIRVEHAGQIAVVGDRLLTDVVMASMMGSWSIWIKDGVVENRGLVSGNYSCRRLRSSAHPIPVLEGREKLTEISNPTRLQSSNPKNEVIDGFGWSSRFLRPGILLPHHSRMRRSSSKH